MATTKKDPTDPIRRRASRYPDVDEGTACTQSAFKTGGKAFLYVGMQGGRFKAMFKLEASKPEAVLLAKKEPERFDVGSTAWVTARFTAEDPMPKKLWEKWLDESYQLSQPTKKQSKSTKQAKPKKKKTPKKALKKTTRKTTKRKPAKKTKTKSRTK